MLLCGELEDCWCPVYAGIVQQNRVLDYPFLGFKCDIQVVEELDDVCVLEGGQGFPVKDSSHSQLDSGQGSDTPSVDGWESKKSGSSRRLPAGFRRVLRSKHRLVEEDDRVAFPHPGKYRGSEFGRL